MSPDRQLAEQLTALFYSVAAGNGKGQLNWLGEQERTLLLLAIGIAAGVALERDWTHDPRGM